MICLGFLKFIALVKVEAFMLKQLHCISGRDSDYSNGNFRW